MKQLNNSALIVVRGGGDLATGTIYKLYQCGFSVLVLECENPMAIRRCVAFSEAVRNGSSQVEDVTCFLAKNWDDAKHMLDEGKLVMLVDPVGKVLKDAKPVAVVDAIIAKKNLGTNRQMAPITIALGPGFEAGVDVDAVIETKRGHNLGRIIYKGCAAPNTGIPGTIAGYGKERVIHAECAGILYSRKKIGDLVEVGETIAVITNEKEIFEVKASLTGVLRGMIQDGFYVTKGFKIADIDPRETEQKNCFTISDKARCIAGGVLEALLYLMREKD
ncbi:MAG: selenium-dependent molybdenum cofactor biosynthesis protein YqeB [Lachnospiraceae bacterium]